MIKKVSFLLLSLFFCRGVLFAESHADVLGDSFLQPVQIDENLTHLFFNKSSDLIGPSIALAYQGRFWTAVQLQKLYSYVSKIEDDTRKLEALSVIKKYLAQDPLKYSELTEEGFSLMYLFTEYEITPFWFIDFPGWALFSEGIKPFEIDLDINELMSAFVDDKVILPLTKKIKDNKLITRRAFNLAQQIKKNYSQNYFAFLYFSKPGLGILNAVTTLLGGAGVLGAGYLVNQYLKFRARTISARSSAAVAKSPAQESVINENQFRSGFSVALFRLKKGKPTFIVDPDKSWLPLSVAQDPSDLSWKYVSYSDGRADAPLMIIPAHYACNSQLRLIKNYGTNFRMVYQKTFNKKYLLTEKDTFVDGEFWTLDQVYLLLEKVIKQPELVSDTFCDRFFGRRFTSDEEKIRYFVTRLKLMFPHAEFRSRFFDELGMVRDFLVASDIQQALPSIFASSHDSNSLFVWFKRCAWWMQSQKNFRNIPHLMFDADCPEQAPLISYDESYKLMCELLENSFSADRDLKSHKFSDVFSKPAWLCDDRWNACLRFRSSEFSSKNSVQSKVFQGLSAENCFDSRGVVLDPSKLVIKSAVRTLEDAALSEAQKEALILMRAQGLSLIPYVSEWPENYVVEFLKEHEDIGSPEDPFWVESSSDETSVSVRSLTDDKLCAEPTRRHTAVVKMLDHQQRLETPFGEWMLFAQAAGKFFLTGNELRAGDCFLWNKDESGYRKLRLVKRFQPAIDGRAASFVDKNDQIKGSFSFELLSVDFSGPFYGQRIDPTAGVTSIADWFDYFDANGYSDDVMIAVTLPQGAPHAAESVLFNVQIFIRPQTDLIFAQLTALLQGKIDQFDAERIESGTAGDPYGETLRLVARFVSFGRSSS